MAVGDNTEGQCNFSGWSGIVAIAASRYHTVGLKSDGTAVAAGDAPAAAVFDWSGLDSGGDALLISSASSSLSWMVAKRRGDTVLKHAP